MIEKTLSAEEAAVMEAVSDGDGEARERIGRVIIEEEKPAMPVGAFAPTEVERSKRRRQAIARAIFMVMAFSLVIPVMAILCYLVVKAWPVLSWSFLIENKRDRMTAGGFWEPL